MKSLPGRPGSAAASLWMRVRVALFGAAAAFLGCAPLLASTPARAEADRPLLAAFTVGIRSFDSDVSLKSEGAFGARFGMGVSDRLSVWIDALTSSPTRRLTTEKATVTALRAIAQAHLLTGTIRPYLVLGAGGLIFNFEDTFDTAGGIMTAGGGVDWRFSPRALLFAEGTADLYRTRMVTYSATGQEVSSSPRETQSATAVSAGIAVEF